MPTSSVRVWCSRPPARRTAWRCLACPAPRTWVPADTCCCGLRVACRSRVWRAACRRITCGAWCTSWARELHEEPPRLRSRWRRCMRLMHRTTSRCLMHCPLRTPRRQQIWATRVAPLKRSRPSPSTRQGRRAAGLARRFCGSYVRPRSASGASGPEKSGLATGSFASATWSCSCSSVPTRSPAFRAKRLLTRCSTRNRPTAGGASPAVLPTSQSAAARGARFAERSVAGRREPRRTRRMSRSEPGL